jgi:hypothetical protein
MGIQNHDIVGLVQRSDRFRYELLKSVSAGTSELNEFDKKRLTDALASLNAYLNWVVSQPQLDLPESNPQDFAVATSPAPAVVESEIVNDIIRIMDVLRIEMVESQSARKAAGLIKFDELRFRSVLTKIGAYLTNYVAGFTPLDLPESSPSVALSGPGKTYSSLSSK